MAVDSRKGFIGFIGVWTFRVHCKGLKGFKGTWSESQRRSFNSLTGLVVQEPAPNASLEPSAPIWQFTGLEFRVSGNQRYSFGGP